MAQTMLAALILVQALQTVEPALPAGALEDYRKLEACIAEVERDPEAGYESARAWIAQTERWEGLVCAAIAEVARGRPEVGARQLERLAGGSDASPAANRASLYAQAGNAWLLARDPIAARDALSKALEIAGPDPDYLIDRARALAMAEDYRRAEEDLSAALDRRPQDRLALILRSEARLRQAAYGLAVRDAEAALAAAPDDVDAAVQVGRATEALRLQAVPED